MHGAPHGRYLSIPSEPGRRVLRWYDAAGILAPNVIGLRQRPLQGLLILDFIPRLISVSQIA